jgi:hypothetical protein
VLPCWHCKEWSFFSVRLAGYVACIKKCKIYAKSGLEKSRDWMFRKTWTENGRTIKLRIRYLGHNLRKGFHPTVIESYYQATINMLIFLSFLFWSLLPTHSKCRGLMLHLTTLSDTYTRGKIPLDERSALGETSAWHNSQHSTSDMSIQKSSTGRNM